MRKYFYLIAILFITTAAFAAPTQSIQNLGTAFKDHKTVNSFQIKDDMTIVYTGQDISKHPIITA